MSYLREAMANIDALGFNEIPKAVKEYYDLTAYTGRYTVQRHIDKLDAVLDGLKILQREEKVNGQKEVYVGRAVTSD